NLSISLFDPPGATAELFERVKLPFQRIRTLEAIANVEQGLLIVGEEISFRRFRSLPELLIATASRGVPVLCLAPSEGMLALPLGGPDAPTPLRGLSFRKSDVITELDRRLDAEQWVASDERGLKQGVIAAGFVLLSDRGGVTGEVVTDG